MHVDPVEHRTGKPLLIGKNLGVAASAFLFRVTEKTTRTRIHSGNEHEIGGVSAESSSATNINLFILKWLPKGFQSRAWVFGISSRKRTPKYAKLISPGIGCEPPPIREVQLDVWWGARKGRVVTTFSIDSPARL